MNKKRVLDISWGTILKIAVAALAFYFIFLIRDILVLFIFALIISILFNSPINFLCRFRIPRTVSTILVYFFAFAVIGFSFYKIGPLLVSEIGQLTKFIPQYFEKISPPLRELGLKGFESFGTFSQNLQRWLESSSSNILSSVTAIFGGIFSTIIIFATALFLSFEKGFIEKTLRLLVPKNYESVALEIWKDNEKKVVSWFGVRLLCSFFVGLASFVVLKLLNVNYPAILGLFAGVLDIIPIIGPIFSGFVIAVIVLLDSWTKMMLVLAAFILIQQIEGNVVLPLIAKKTIGLPPALVLIAVMAGVKIWGVLGAILAVPVAGILFKSIKDFLEERKERENQNVVS